ncbi:MAG: SDR family NAD(P)-dependent oxidoreductase [Gammaproteobacteria bacterium]|nr:SDR family NAD(P)-dependent oxidoreductase [Gammaproteobacteria bacterium]
MDKPANTDQPNALVIGSNGTIARALIAQLGETHRVATLSRKQTDYSEPGLQAACSELAELGTFDRIICCVGILQDSEVSPEKNLKQVTAAGLAHYYQVNTIIPMLCLKYFHPLLNRHNPSVFACLSAMVGSIGDNQLGGWYGYRSSKTALNMLIKNTAIEVARSNKNACIIAVHPGTTVSALSKPFSANVKPEKYYPPEQSASRIIAVMNQLGDADSGRFFNWNGEPIPW